MLGAAEAKGEKAYRKLTTFSSLGRMLQQHCQQQQQQLSMPSC